MKLEVVDGHFDAFALLQILEGLHEQFEVEGVGVVEVVLVLVRQRPLLLVKIL